MKTFCLYLAAGLCGVSVLAAGYAAKQSRDADKKQQSAVVQRARDEAAQNRRRDLQLRYFGVRTCLSVGYTFKECRRVVNGAVLPPLTPAVEKKIIKLIGRPGKSGPLGLKGLRGLAGKLGIAGKNGKNGSPGLRGLPGATGSQGARGAQGTQGSAGSTGARGGPGPSGVRGPVGPAGPQGPPGLPGPQGAPAPPFCPGVHIEIFHIPSVGTKKIPVCP